MLEKMSPTTPSFGYGIIQISELKFRILFIGLDRNVEILYNLAKEYNAILIDAGWGELSDEQSNGYFDLYDMVFDIYFPNTNDAMLFKLRWG